MSIKHDNKFLLDEVYDWFLSDYWDEIDYMLYDIDGLSIENDGVIRFKYRRQEYELSIKPIEE